MSHYVTREVRLFAAALAVYVVLGLAWLGIAVASYSPIFGPSAPSPTGWTQFPWHRTLFWAAVVFTSAAIALPVWRHGSKAAILSPIIVSTAFGLSFVVAFGVGSLVWSGSDGCFLHIPELGGFNDVVCGPIDPPQRWVSEILTAGLAALVTLVPTFAVAGITIGLRFFIKRRQVASGV